ncbi:ankycorbin-like [Mytilus edulis]|uniref:ankycorbin-like n=1 Tax=Mytilus edulis TaxID=6550 RepID=UPI0039EEEE9C
MLLDRGVDCNECYKNGNSSVMMASKNGHTEIVEMLLDRGAHCDTYDKDGQSPVNCVNMKYMKAMFGYDGKIGLLPSSLPQEILGSLQTEEDLTQHLQNSDNPDEISNDKPNELSSDIKPNEHNEVSQPK